MSTVTPRDDNPIDRDEAQTSELITRIEQLEERQDTLEARNDELEERSEQLEQELEQERAARRRDRHALARENHELHSELDEYRKDNERDKADIRGDLHKLRDAVKPAIGMAESQKLDDNPGGQTEETTMQRRESSLEQICGLPEDMAHKELTMNMERARYVALRITSFGTNTQQGGFSLKSAKLKRILDDFDMSGHTQTVTRVMDFLKEFGRDGEVKTKINDDGKKLVWFDIDLVRRLSQITPDESDGSISRVVIGGRG